MHQMWAKNSKDHSSCSNDLERSVPKRPKLRFGLEQNVRRPFRNTECDAVLHSARSSERAVLQCNNAAV